MGSWGHLLYNNDDALDTLADLDASIDLDAGPDHLVGGVALLAWLFPSRVRSQPDDIRGALTRGKATYGGLSGEARRLIEAAQEDPLALLGEASRTPQVRRALGSYEAGTFHESLFSACSEQTVVEALAERCRLALDTLPRRREPYFATLTHAGVLLELRRLGVRTDDMRTAGWTHGLDAAARAASGSFAESYFERAEWVMRRIGFDPFNAARRTLRLADEVEGWRLLFVSSLAPALCVLPNTAGLEVRAGEGDGPLVALLPFVEDEREGFDALVKEAALEGAPRNTGHGGVTVCLETTERERVAWTPDDGSSLGALASSVLSNLRGQDLVQDGPLAAALSALWRALPH